MNELKNEVDVSRTIELVNEAFSEAENPHHNALPIYNWLVRLLDTPRNEIPIEMLQRDCESFTALRVYHRVFFHYLPAFLVSILSNPQEMRACAGSVLLVLDPNTLISSRQDLERAGLNIFSPKQKRAILAFLECYQFLFSDLITPIYFSSEDNAFFQQWLDEPLPPPYWEVYESAVAYWKSVQEQE
jgi:hypothetical protein